MTKLPIRSQRIAPTLSYRTNSHYLLRPLYRCKNRSASIREYSPPSPTSSPTSHPLEHFLPAPRPSPDNSLPSRIRNKRSMSSDAAYAAFLEKANSDSVPAASKDASKKKEYGTRSLDTAVIPKALEQVQEYYTSDADEPFEPVSLKYSGESISADELKELLGGDQDVEQVEQQGFERQYKRVVDAVKSAVGSGEVKVFKVGLDGTRSEYFVVGVDEQEGRLVGLKALAVES